MNVKEQLFAFEEKYPFLYREMVGGVSVYTCLRDDVAARLSTEERATEKNASQIKGKIYIRRVLATFFKWRKYRKAETLIFTSSVYRRDKGRNLSAEFLLQKYPNGVVFEWPSRNQTFDKAYFSDKAPYVPLDGYLIRYKLYCKLHKKEIRQMERECRTRLQKQFEQNPPTSEAYKRAVEYLMEALPTSVAATAISQRIFARMFRKHKKVRYAVDFWGSGRENIIPILQGNPQSIELQHGLITPAHPGYVYPSFVQEVDSPLFKRKILTFDKKTSRILTENSIFHKNQIEVVGNPRLIMYKQFFQSSGLEKKWILFTSQTFEQDGAGARYYDTVIPILNNLASKLKQEGHYQLAIKLHPRENQCFAERYKTGIEGAVIFDNSKDLYEVISQSYFHLTATSTTLFEAAELDVPTAIIQYKDYTPRQTFGFDVLCINNEEKQDLFFALLKETQKYEEYLKMIKKEIADRI